MPTYEYRCPNGHEFEKFFRTISAAAGEHPCPTCGAVGLRQLSGGGLMFKGSGFYLTDYGKNAHASKGPVPKSGAEGSGGASDPAAAAGSKSGGGESTGAPASGASKAESSSSTSSSGGESGGKSSTPKPKTGE